MLSIKIGAGCYRWAQAERCIAEEGLRNFDAATELLEKAKVAAVKLDGGGSFLKEYDSEVMLIECAKELSELRARLEELERANPRSGSQPTPASQSKTAAQAVWYEPN